MFFEFDPATLEKWHQLPEDERQKAIDEHSVDLAATVEIVITYHGEITNEHKYYQITRYARLLGGRITINSITEQEMTFYVNDTGKGDKPELHSAKISEEKSVQVGSAPYGPVYQVKAYDITYGQMMEL